MASSKSRKFSAPQTLTEALIEERVGQQSFERGERYFQSGALSDLCREGRVLKGRCRGKSASHYYLWIEVQGSQILKGDCNCPVGEGGYCKHTAALLLTWLHQPETFREVAPLAERLANCSHEQLQDLVKFLIKNDPETERWINLFLQTLQNVETEDEVAETSCYFDQTIAALERSDEDYDRACQDIERLIEIGIQFFEQNQPVSATAVFEGIIQGICQGYLDYNDYNFEIMALTTDSLLHLQNCLVDFPEDLPARQSVVQTCYQLLKWDLEGGGLGFNNGATPIILDCFSSSERQRIAEWLQRDFQNWAADSEVSGWMLNLYRETLLGLLGNPEDDPQGYLQLCRELSLTEPLIAQLIKQGDYEEALPELEALDISSFMSQIDQLTEHKQTKLARQAVLKRWHQSFQNAPGDHYSSRELSGWLRQHSRNKQQKLEVLELLLNRFQVAPSEDLYTDAEALATALKCWPSTQRQLMETLPKCSLLKIRLLIQQKQYAEAISLLDHLPGSEKLARPCLELQLAEVAGKEFPDFCLQILNERAERQIAQRTRDSYRSACQHLKQVKKIYTQQKWDQAWSEYRDRLCQTYCRLPALLDEMKKARL